MLNILEVNETNKMISEENFDVRTITIGISLIDCIDSNVDILCQNIYNKITSVAKDLVKTANNIENKFGVPIVNKRVSVTPISLIGASSVKTIDDYVKIAKTLDEAAKAIVDIVKEAGGKPFLTDCNTLYPGSRKNALDHFNFCWQWI